MTGLSTRGIAALLEREARARGRLDLRTAVDWLRELGVPDDRIRAGLALALHGERVALADDDDGRPALVITAPTEATP